MYVVHDGFGLQYPNFGTWKRSNLIWDISFNSSIGQVPIMIITIEIKQIFNLIGIPFKGQFCVSCRALIIYSTHLVVKLFLTAVYEIFLYTILQTHHIYIKVMRKRVFLQGGILLHISFPYLVHTSRSSLSSHHVTRTNEIILLSCIFFRDFFSSLKFTELAALWISLNKKCAKSKGVLIFSGPVL